MMPVQVGQVGFAPITYPNAGIDRLTLAEAVEVRTMLIADVIDTISDGMRTPDDDAELAETVADALIALGWVTGPRTLLEQAPIDAETIALEQAPIDAETIARTAKITGFLP